MDGGAWWAAVHGVAEGRTWLSDFTFTFYFHALEKEMATHSSVLAWRIPETEEPWWAAVYGVTRNQTRLSDFAFTFHFPALEKEMAIHSSVLAWRIPGMGEPGGLPSMGSHRVGHDWSDLAAAAAAYADYLIHVHVANPWTIACQAPLSMGFSKQEYWSWLPCPPPGDLPEPGIKPGSLTSPASAGFFITSSTWEAHLIHGTQHHFITCVSWFARIGYSGNLEDTSKCRGSVFPFSES